MIIKIIAINTNAKKFLIFNFYFFKIFLHGRVYRVRQKLISLYSYGTKTKSCKKGGEEDNEETEDSQPKESGTEEEDNQAPHDQAQDSTPQKEVIASTKAMYCLGTDKTPLPAGFCVYGTMVVRQ